jgi:uncharacterized protein YecE (DUF72 family)
MGRILVGISAWADPELAKSGFYPAELKTSAERLHYYAQKFSLTEIDSSYHFMPTRRNVSLWIESTPPGFVFDVKAFSLFTGHPTPLESLPGDLREKARSALNKQNHLYIHGLSQEIADDIWERFARSVLPLHSAGKLGLIDFQFPAWFHPSPENFDYISRCREKLSQYRLAVEFRTGGWLEEGNRERTLHFLRKNGLCLVCVDEPQGLKSSVPILDEVTAPIGVVRFHGRNTGNWEAKNIPVSEKYSYLYNEAELREWLPKIEGMAGKAEEIHVIFKNKHRDFPVRNARMMMEMLKNRPGSSF